MDARNQIVSDQNRGFPFTKTSETFNKACRIRLRTGGVYYISLCTFKRESIFGCVHPGGVVLNKWGSIAQDCWNSIPLHFPGVNLDEYVIMPNHLHGILIMEGSHVESILRQLSPQPPQSEDSALHTGTTTLLGNVLGSFKGAVTKAVRDLQQDRHIVIWQRNYHEHVIRSDRDLDRIRNYIRNNPLRWHLDCENPLRTGNDDLEPIF